jgi:hypothetical protein
MMELADVGAFRRKIAISADFGGKLRFGGKRDFSEKSEKASKIPKDCISAEIVGNSRFCRIISKIAISAYSAENCDSAEIRDFNGISQKIVFQRISAKNFKNFDFRRNCDFGGKSSEIFKNIQKSSKIAISAE